MPDAPRPPEGWSLYHSIGLLLVGASVIDGVLDPEEVSRIRQRLAEYPEIEGAEGASALLKPVVAHYHELREAGTVMPALDRHCRKLAKALPEAARKVVADDVIAVVGSDGVVHPVERDSVAAVCRHVEIEVPPGLSS